MIDRLLNFLFSKPNAAQMYSRFLDQIPSVFANYKEDQILITDQLDFHYLASIFAKKGEAYTASKLSLGNESFEVYCPVSNQGAMLSSSSIYKGRSLIMSIVSVPWKSKQIPFKFLLPFYKEGAINAKARYFMLHDYQGETYLVWGHEKRLFQIWIHDWVKFNHVFFPKSLLKAAV